MTPALYLEMRDSCIKRKTKKSGTCSEADKKACQKMAAIMYYKQTGKSVNSADAELALAEELPDEIELEILSEQLDFFGSIKEYEDWNNSLQEVENGIQNG